MMKRVAAAVLAMTFGGSVHAADDEHHSHPAPERLGTVTFPTSCQAAVKPAFVRAVALLHSFAYDASELAFRDVAGRDPGCAIAHWGIAMSLFHQLWEPPAGEELREGAKQVRRAVEIRAGSLRERQFIEALDTYYRDPEHEAPAVRAVRYANAMADVARSNPGDAEAQIFYALALIATAPPADRAHTNQKRAAEILEPIFRQQPQHPGLAHYLIHAYDSAELAPRGLVAARAYSKIAPSAPHALHMPSHIFTRLGLWDDSIASNQAARAAAHKQGEVGDELHAMDYLVYAYLQSGRDADAAEVVQQLRNMSKLDTEDFIIGYASTAIPVRYAIERGQWADAASIVPPPGAPPHVVAIAVWARGLGLARSGRLAEAQTETDRLRQIEVELRTSGNDYWATQVGILVREVMAWSAQTNSNLEEAVALMREAADKEDTIEKLPVTPGPILPAREQLGYLLLQQNHPGPASKEFATALANAPGRRGALQGAARAAELSSQK